MLKLLCLAVTIVAHDPGYYTSLANHLQRWLKGEQIAAKVVRPAEMSKALAAERLAFLVGFASPSSSEMATLRAFRQRGGKLVVFHSASPELGALMGVQPVGYRAATYPGEWSRMNFVGSALPEGTPASILQTSTVLQRARAVPGRSRVLATWSDRQGKSGGEPAWLASNAGYWMTHVLLADGEEPQKAKFLAAIVGSVEPRLWNVRAHAARTEAKARACRDYAMAQQPVRGEIRAVWDHSGCGLYPGNWGKTIALLKSASVTDIFVNVAGAGFAHYPSAVLPHSKTFELEGDQLAKCLKAAAGTGIRVHAWILCFTATRAAPETLERFRKRGWRLKTARGALTEYLDPARPEVRAHVLSAIEELGARYPVAGIHLDFIRYGDSAVKPRNASSFVTQLVRDARFKVRRPKWLTAAVYGKYPNCVGSVGQDWDSWLGQGLVDYVVPMDYTDSPAMLESLLRQQAATPGRARRTIVGIGVTANESRLDAREVIDQIRMARRYGMAGESLFDLDTVLEKSILPYLKMGIWRNGH